MATASVPFYGHEQAVIHDRDFGDLARAAGQRLVDELQRSGITGGTVIDLACGSGILARILTAAGYQVLGCDISAAMVELAAAAAPAATFVHGSLWDLPLPPAVAVTAVGEALNYAADDRAGLAATAALLERVHAVLDPRGVMLGDVAGPGRNRGETFVRQIHDRRDWTLHMVAEESDDRTRLDRRIAIFTRTGADTYRRTDEHHVLQLYAPDDLHSVFGAAGFDVWLEPGYSEQRTSSTPVPGWTVFVARPHGVPGSGRPQPPTAGSAP